MSIYGHVSKNFRHTLSLKSHISFCNHASTYIQLSKYLMNRHILSFLRWCIFIKSFIHLSPCIQELNSHPNSKANCMHIYPIIQHQMIWNVLRFLRWLIYIHSNICFSMNSRQTSICIGSTIKNTP